MSTDGFRAIPTPSPACETARRLIAAFIENELDRGAAARLRVHLQACAACHAEYVEKVNSVARLGQQLKDLEREASEHPHELSMEPELSSDRPTDYIALGRRHRRFALRGTGVLVALVAIVLTVALCVPNEVVRKLSAQAVGGRVEITNQAVLQSGEHVDWTRGQWCAVPLGSSAYLSSPNAKLEVDGPAQVLLEVPDPLRARLESGLARIEGEVTLTHGLAIVMTKGRAAQARARVANGELEVSCTAGLVALVSASGELSLAPGESARVDKDGELVRLRSDAR